ncbi:hypothetical protein [Pontibacter sp. G13]|uniref:hypothetical protein n=1 Tax=Pontibacter sp. G13 TaxID=3074898 RepID=UPI00288AC1A4|nr:hypothetical protein [Pontibacter sp. G13]WNJ19453.1 hypothetical protein RJD25_03080 [Pontibacter sp. G13]
MRPLHEIPTPPDTDTYDRPRGMYLLCLAGILAIAWDLHLAFTAEFHPEERWFSMFMLISSGVSAYSLSGMYLGKKWAAFTYPTVVFVNQIAWLMTEEWTSTGMILPAIVSLMGLWYSKDMK